MAPWDFAQRQIPLKSQGPLFHYFNVSIKTSMKIKEKTMHTYVYKNK